MRIALKLSACAGLAALCLMCFAPPAAQAEPPFAQSGSTGDAPSPVHTAGRSGSLRVTMPKAGYTGEAVVAVATAPRSSSFTFRWLGKEVTVPTQPAAGGAYAQILLPIPLEERSPRLVLRVSGPEWSKVEIDLTVLRKDRPKQELKVAPAYVEPPAEAQARIKAEAERVRTVLAGVSPQRLWKIPLDRPVPGEISGEFGAARVFNGQARNPHKGLDLRAKQGEPVRAAADGVVALADDLYFSGKVVYLDHGVGVFTVYAHLSALDVRQGQKVAKGKIIGKAGATGRATGPHLHFGCYALGLAVDPVPLTEE